MTAESCAPDCVGLYCWEDMVGPLVARRLDLRVSVIIAERGLVWMRKLWCEWNGGKVFECWMRRSCAKSCGHVRRVGVSYR
jgi:hypothetical protein